MTTSAAGGKITGLLALTMVGTAALAVGDPVHVSADYTVVKADGTKPVIGHVSVSNVKRVAGAYPVGNAGGDVTVEARAFYIRTIVSGAAITVGTEVGIGASNTLVPAGSNVATIGVALMGAGASGTPIDVMVN